MQEYEKHGELGRASRAAGMDRGTARKYVESGRLPSELVVKRDWRTREDPFAEDWPEIRVKLELSPGLEATSVLQQLIERDPERYQERHLRTLQRRFKRWRATCGPDKVVYFPQEHRPGEAMQTDFTWGTELEVTIGGESFPHLLCHPVLPYSNWEWVTVCRSESMAALRRGVQEALFQIGRTPQFHQTDNSTAATHDLRTGKRGFNEEYVALMDHLGMRPRTIGIGESEQNGDVEAANGAFKRRVRQALLLRQSAEFESVEEYEKYLQSIAAQANRGRQQRFAEELATMRALAVARLPEYSELKARVSGWSTIRVHSNVYSLPSRLIGEQVRARIYDTHLEIFYAGERQLAVERLQGKQRHHVNYRHVIESLVRKPGAFERYRYREDLFPSVIFRRAYDALIAAHSPRKADIEYLRCLQLAARTMECKVEAALQRCLAEGVLPSADAIKALVDPTPQAVPELEPLAVELEAYDELLGSQEVA
jgi:hypothetical protein